MRMATKRRARKPARTKPQRKPRPRAPLNLSLRTDVVARAKKLKLNISEIADAALEVAVRKAEHQRWLDENKEAFEYYNKWVEEHGIFGEEWRQF
jgi:antitoxin CcdA